MDDVKTPAPALRKLFPLQWAVQKRTPLHWFQGAAAQEKWQDGVSLITEADFDAAVEAIQTMPISAIHPSEV